VAVYDGSWLEWSQDPNNPIEMGVLVGLAEADVQVYV